MSKRNDHVNKTKRNNAVYNNAAYRMYIFFSFNSNLKMSRNQIKPKLTKYSDHRKKHY